MISNNLTRVKYKRSVVKYRAFAIGQANDTKDESVREGAGVLVGSRVSNCDCADGVLRATAGLSAFKLASGAEVSIGAISGVREFFLLPTGESTEKFGCITADGKMYLYDEGAGSFSLVHSFGVEMKTAVACDADGKYYLALCGGAGIYTYTSETGVVRVLAETVLPIACVVDGRVFYAQSPRTVGYSAPFDRGGFGSDIHGGGKLVLPDGAGEIVGLTAFHGNVYIFYEHALAKLSVAGSAREFEVEEIAYCGGEIFGDSVGVCGEKAFFLATDGLYVLREKGVGRVCENLTLNPKREGQVCNHGVSEGKYYLTFSDTTDKFCGVAVDVASEKGHYIYAVEGLSAVGGEAVCQKGNKVVCYRADGTFPSGVTAEFEVEGATFGVGENKTLETMRLLIDGAVILTVQTDKRKTTYYFVNSQGKTPWKVRMRGKWFRFHFQLFNGSAVRGMEVEFSVPTGVE